MFALVAVLGWVFLVLMGAGRFKSDKEEDDEEKDEDEDQPISVPRLALTVVSGLFAVAAGLTFHYTRRITTLKTHVEALHLLYVFEKMPVTGVPHVMYSMKVKRPQNKVIKYSHYSVLTDGSFREDEDPVCC